VAARIHSPAVQKSIEVEVEGTIGRFTLLETWAPRLTAAIWDLLPVDAKLVHGRLSGDVALFAVRSDRFVELPAEPEMAVTSIYKGYMVCNVFPTMGLMDLTISYGIAEYRRATGIAYTTPVARIEGDGEAFLKVVQRTRREGEKPIEARRVEQPAR
jgi:hypothetical protein